MLVLVVELIFGSQHPFVNAYAYLVDVRNGDSLQHVTILETKFDEIQIILIPKGSLKKQALRQGLGSCAAL